MFNPCRQAGRYYQCTDRMLTDQKLVRQVILQRKNNKTQDTSPDTGQLSFVYVGSMYECYDLSDWLFYFYPMSKLYNGTACLACMHTSQVSFTELAVACFVFA